MQIPSPILENEDRIRSPQRTVSKGKHWERVEEIRDLRVIMEEQMKYTKQFFFKTEIAAK